MSLPSPHAAIAIAIATLTFWLFARGRVRVELICLGLIATLALLFYFFPMRREGAYTGMEVAFGGFGHEALIAICCLMILGRGLVVTGALEPFARLMTGLWRFSKALGLLFSLILGAAISMFVNDTPVLVLTMPILLNLAQRVGVPASKTLMPMNCAILIGGMATTVGTSTNLLVVSIAEDLGLPRFGVFQFSDIALTAALVALPYLWLIMPRLLPAHDALADQAARRFEATLHVVAGSSAIGASLAQLRQRLGAGVEAFGVRPRAREWPHRQAGAALAQGDEIHIAGVLAELREASAALSAPLVSADADDALRAAVAASGEDQIVGEVVLGVNSTLIGESVKSVRIADRYGVAVIGLHRPNPGSFYGVAYSADERLAIGDVLLVQGAASALRQLQIGEGGMMLEGAAEMPRTGKAPAALLIVATVVAAASLRLVPIAISALAGAIAMLALGVVKFDRIGRALSAEVIVLVAASIALGRTIMETGAADWLGSTLILGLRSFPPGAVLAAMMTFCAILTNLSSNTAAAAVGAPIGVSIAQQMHIPAEPLVLAVLFGCNLCYATPIAYQTNMLIMSAGGYGFRDYVRAGLPLVLLMIASLSILLVRKYGI